MTEGKNHSFSYNSSKNIINEYHKILIYIISDVFKICNFKFELTGFTANVQILNNNDKIIIEGLNKINEKSHVNPIDVSSKYLESK